MADVLISDLSFSQPLSGDELLPIVQNGTSYKVSVSSVGNAGDTQNINGCDNTIVSGSIVSSIVGGCSNTLDGNCSAILGGNQNTLSADFGFIGSGTNHTINSIGSIIGGGSQNTIEENTYIDTIGGGNGNCVGASFKNSFIGGGLGNTMTSDSTARFCSSFSSYTNSIISGRENALGGFNFTKTMCSNTIAGGQFNGIGGVCLQTYPNEDFTANHNFIGGGKRNAINGHCSGIAAGYGNEIFSNLSGAFIGGGVYNTIRNVDGTTNGHHSSILGGKCNYMTSSCGSIAGGESNNANGNWSTITGGLSNCASSSFTTVAGGKENRASGVLGAIGGGQSNISHGNHSVVGGGDNNTNLGNCSFTGGGKDNITGVIAYHSFIGGGQSNAASSQFTGILGGRNNTASHTDSFIVGSNITSVSSNMLHANTLYLSAAALPTTDPGIPGVVWRDGTDLKISV